jgi:acyl-CoA synthetase (NDP forming)/RimJ/RimL family protein N-acetyltransferase
VVPGLVRDVILRDGSTLRLRSPERADLDEIEAFFADLTLESRYRRFHGAGNLGAVARQYTEADGENRVALIGRHGGRMVAVAGYERLREPGVADVAFAVTDDQQGRGTGTRMLEQLAHLGAERGIERFTADVLSENRRMLRVFSGAGFEVLREGLGGSVHLTFDITGSDELTERIAARDHVSALASLRPLLAPASVAVVGASERGVGATMLERLVDGGFAGHRAAVNRSGRGGAAVPVVRRLADLDPAPELVIVAVPAAEVIGVAREAAEVGVRALLVVSAGFSDRSDEGLRREEELLEVVRAGGMRLVGPNSLGVLNTDAEVRLNATLGQFPLSTTGAVAISSQSGALGIALLGHAAGRGIGVGRFVSLGNRADVSTNDLLELWEDDESVAVIVLYVESFGNPGRFASISRRVSARKPIIVVKGDRRRPPLVGAASHTASGLHGEDIVNALFRQAGVLRVDGTGALFDAAEVLESQPLPAGRSVAVVTNSGGLGTLAADACLTRALGLAELTSATQERLDRELPAADRTRNPVDMGIGAAPEDYGAAVAALLDDDGVDAVIALGAQVEAGDPGPSLVAVEAAAAARGKPVVASMVDEEGRLAARAETGAHPRVPNLPFPEACVAALALAADRRDWLSRPLGQPLVPKDIDLEGAQRLAAAALAESGPGWMDPRAAEELLRTHGIPVESSRRSEQVADAVRVAASIEGPVVLKADLPPPAHASDLDAVLIGLEGEEAIRAAWDELARRLGAAGRECGGAAVQSLVGTGADVLVGAVRDRDLGPLLAAGLGGRQAGLGAGLYFRLAPVTDADAEDLLSGAVGLTAVLDGARGRPRLDRGALRDLVLRFSELVRTVPEIIEADLNPIRAMPAGCRVLDVRVRLDAHPRDDRVKTW